MRKFTILSQPKPILKPKAQQHQILSILPQPPTVHREIPAPLRDKITPTDPSVGVKKTLMQAIDYDKLTPTQQARWDAGMYGSIELKSCGIYNYYYLRWLDPETKKYRSTYLAKDWHKALAKMQELTGHESN